MFVVFLCGGKRAFASQKLKRGRNQKSL